MNRFHLLKRFSPLVSLSASISLALFASTARAQFYEVEMTVFTNTNPAYVQEQTWPKNIKVNYPANLASLSQQSAEDIYPELFQPNRPSAKPNLIPLLGTRFNKHNDAVNKLETSGQHHVLFHQTWLQKVEGEEFAQNIIIQSGDSNNNVYELGGTVSFFQTPVPDKQETSLHIKTQLWHVDFSNGANSSQSWPTPPAFTISDNGITPVKVENNPDIQRIAVLKAAEIVTRNTLHYIDNPLFGVLVEIRPYSAIQLSE